MKMHPRKHTIDKPTAEGTLRAAVEKQSGTTVCKGEPVSVEVGSAARIKGRKNKP